MKGSTLSRALRRSLPWEVRARIAALPLERLAAGQNAGRQAARLAALAALELACAGIAIEGSSTGSFSRAVAGSILLMAATWSTMAWLAWIQRRNIGALAALLRCSSAKANAGDAWTAAAIACCALAAWASHGAAGSQLLAWSAAGAITLHGTLLMVGAQELLAHLHALCRGSGRKQEAREAPRLQARWERRTIQ